MTLSRIEVPPEYHVVGATTSGTYRLLTVLVFVFSLLLRFGLAVVNREANDDHISVIRIIAIEHRMPDDQEHYEAYHPKLYHLTVAIVSRLLSIRSSGNLLLTAQLLSFVAGCFTLAVVVALLNRICASEEARLMTFALVALNPALVGISAQATNDAFVILFGTLTLYFSYEFFSDWKARHFAGMTFCAILALLSKANAVVLAIAVVAIFTAGILTTRSDSSGERRLAAVYAGIFIAALLISCATLGPYWDHYRRYGSPFSVNVQPNRAYSATLADQLARDNRFPFRPGFTSIRNSFLTFRLVDMVREPAVTPDLPHLAQRTSLWSQLYARTHFIQYGGHPSSWAAQPDSPRLYALILNLGRALFLCALFPIAVFVFGAATSGLSALKEMRDYIGNKGIGVCLPEWLLIVSVAGYLLSIMQFCYQYRDFASMKVIYMAPGLAGFVVLFVHGYDRIVRCLQSTPVGRRIVRSSVVLVATLYAVDVTALVYQLIR